MAFPKPATPGFVVTLIATILLAIVSFCVPLIKSVYFLKASVQGFNGSLTFGTLGYCLQQSSGTTCSKPSIGYQIDVNTLLGNNTQIQIPSVVVKWVTYALVLHIVALVLAAISSLFGLLAHVREFSMACCSTCVSGFAAAVALLAFAFDLTLFFVTKSRINSVAGGSASMGNAIWLTLVAFILLFFSGFFYCFGRCCISNRSKNKNNNRDYEGRDGNYTEHLRLDAVKAEAERKNKQKLASETGLPAFQEYQPLTKEPATGDYYEDGDRIHRVEDNIGQFAGVGAGMAASGMNEHYAGGYAQAPVGTRAVDEYYTPTRQPSQSQYPPQRQDSGHAVSASNYSTYSGTPPPVPVPQAQPSYLAHNSDGTSYQSAHQQYPTNYSHILDPSMGAYNSGYQPNLYALPPSTATTYHNQPDQQEHERSYSLGGGGYGTNVVPHPQPATHFPYTQQTSPPPMMHSPYSPPPVQSDFQQRHPGTHGHQSSVDYQYEDSPPVYDEAQPATEWTAKSYAL